MVARHCLSSIKWIRPNRLGDPNEALYRGCRGTMSILFPDAQGLFDKRDFFYLTQSDEYLCPAGELAPWRFRILEHGMVFDKFWSSSCLSCAMKPRCTTGDYRWIARWEHEDMLERMQGRLNARPELAIIRRCTVEHPFGTFKAWMGATHFLTTTLPKVRTEMSLHVLAYNMKRMMKIVRIQRLLVR